MTSVRLQSECSVPQAAQVAHRLTIGVSSQVGLVQDRFFKLRIRDDAFRPDYCGSERTDGYRDESASERGRKLVLNGRRCMRHWRT